MQIFRTVMRSVFRKTTHLLKNGRSDQAGGWNGRMASQQDIFHLLDGGCPSVPPPSMGAHRMMDHIHISSLQHLMHALQFVVRPDIVCIQHSDPLSPNLLNARIPCGAQAPVLLTNDMHGKRGTVHEFLGPLGTVIRTSVVYKEDFHGRQTLFTDTAQRGLQK